MKTNSKILCIAVLASSLLATTASATNFALLLAGQSSSDAVSLLSASSFVSLEEWQATEGNVLYRHPGKVKYNNCRLVWSPKSNVALDDWINRVLSGKVDRKSVSVIMMRQSGSEIHTFPDATPTSIRFPACDTSNFEPSGIEVVFSTPGEVKVSTGGKVATKEQKKWLPANFRLSIDGLDEACRRVNKVDSFTIKQGIADLDQDGLPDFVMSRFTFKVPSSFGPMFLDWLTTGAAERACSLDYLDTKGAIMHRLSLKLSPVSVGDLDGDGYITVRCDGTPVKWSPPETISH